MTTGPHAQRVVAGLSLELVSAARTGDPVAVGRLFECLRPVLVRYCRARITPRAGHGGADDLAHEICVAILCGLPKFTGDSHAVLRWVYGIAAHKVVDYYQRSGQDRSEPTERLPHRADPRAGPEELALRGEERAAVLSLLARLKPVQREVLTLRVVAGLSSAEVSAITGLSMAAVRVIQHRALHVLRRRARRGTPVAG